MTVEDRIVLAWARWNERLLAAGSTAPESEFREVLREELPGAFLAAPEPVPDD